VSGEIARPFLRLSGFVFDICCAPEQTSGPLQNLKNISRGPTRISRGNAILAGWGSSERPPAGSRADAPLPPVDQRKRSIAAWLAPSAQEVDTLTGKAFEIQWRPATLSEANPFPPQQPTAIGTTPHAHLILDGLRQDAF